MKDANHNAHAARRLIVFSGAQDWGNQSAKALISLSNIQATKVAYLSGAVPLVKLLGQDNSIVVIDAYHGLNPDVLGQASGTIIASGALIIICPPFTDWPSFSDPEQSKIEPYGMANNGASSYYLSRWARYLVETKGIELCTPESREVIPAVGPNPILVGTSKPANQDQQLAVDSIINTVYRKKRYALLLTANRGRGKSAALGIAAAKLIQIQAAQNVVVTSIGFANTRHVFKHALLRLEGAREDRHRKRIDHEQGLIRYVAPDALLEKPLSCDILLVDEAAALGIHRLKAILQQYSHVVFASTEQGYEGSGRGFSVKFRQLLKKHGRNSHEIKLSEPIRWHQNDPLERWTNALLLLEPDALETTYALAPPSLNNLQFERLDPAKLVENEKHLTRIFQLLVEAHYQTRPNDLRLLLDAPNAQIWLAQYKGEIAGLIWVMLEGGLDSDIANEITVGRRRPQGHLAPQILAAHLGINKAVTLNCARIQRIVVRPQWQNKGIGQWMLSQIEHAIEPNTDYLASSYGIDTQLSRFWQQAGYSAVRLSDTANAASGLRSALVIKPLSQSAGGLVIGATERFQHQLLEQLPGPLWDCSPELLFTLSTSSQKLPTLTLAELEAAILFAFGNRPFESSLASLNKIAQMALLDSSSAQVLTKNTRYLFVMRCLQKQTWAACVKQLKLQGKEQCLNFLKQGVKALLAQHQTKTEVQKIRDQFKL